MSAEPTVGKENSYRSILRGMSAFGGVQILQMVINVIRGKCVAIFLGPEGMGISQLLSSSTLTLRQIVSLGLPLSIVREIAATRSDTDGDDDPDGNRPVSRNTREVIASARTVVRWCAILGMAICIVLSGVLSHWSFDSDAYTWSYIFLSVMVLFSILADGEMSLLQGLHQVKRLSRASLVGASAGLIGGVPLYYFFGNDGIVPALILLALSIWIFYKWNMFRTCPNRRSAVPWKLKWAIIRRMLSLGVVLMAGTVITTTVSYLINMWVRAYGSVGDVGLFQAANSIAGQYVGMIFAALSLDYFPRLATVVSDNRKMTAVANRQMELVALVIAPLGIFLIISAPLLIRLLTSEEFMAVVPLVRWMSVGLFLRGMAYPLGYIAFAKGNRRLYFYMEGLSGPMIMLAVNLICYYVWGLVGLGIAVVIVHAIDCIIYYSVNRHYYGYRVGATVIRLAVILFMAVLISFGLTYIPDHAVSLGISSVLLAGCMWFSWREIHKRIRSNDVDIK